MNEQSELEIFAANLLEYSDERNQARHKVNFIEACERYKQVRGELPLKFRIMLSKLYADATGNKTPLALDLGEHYDKQHAARMGYPAPVGQAIANHFRRVRMKNKGFGR